VSTTEASEPEETIVDEPGDAAVDEPGDAAVEEAAGEDAAATRPPKRGRRRLRRVLLWSGVTLLALILVLSVTAVWAVRRSLPQYSGTARLAGLSAPVTVYRDRYGIPQIYADTAEDLFRAQGYVHAQERFWEMDFRRHVTSGRLAELFGADQVETDTYLRTLGWRRVAEREWDILAEPTRRYLSAYADGVNAWLATHGDGAATGAVSLEYTVLGVQNGDYHIERWTPLDSLSWLKAMAWDLRSNMSDEVERATLLASGLTRAQVEQLFPPYPFGRHRPIIDGGQVAGGAFTATGPSAPAAGPANAPVRDAIHDAIHDAGPLLEAVREGVRRLPPLLGANAAGIGSNSWVIAGSRTTTGKPLLANDPHLAPTMPGIWFQMGLHCGCGLNLAGFTFSGVPGVIIGHNDRIAWGFTNLGPDVTDLYLERIEGNRYQVDGEWVPLDVRTETLKVAGGKPVTITVRGTRNGPLLSDASISLREIGLLPPVDPYGDPVNQPTSHRPGYAVSLRWTALDPGRTADALFALDTARDWKDFRAAAALFEVPAQNMVYADVDGNIGYQSPGRIPVRAKGDGKYPVPGWDSAYQWKGYLPFAELPSVANPQQGFIVTANQAVVGPSYPRFLTDDWAYGYRSQRINDMIAESTGKVSPDDVQRMQFDNRNGMAPAVVPSLTQVPLSGTAAKAQALLSGWDFQQPADGAGGTPQARSSAAAAYYNAVWRHLLVRLFDELPGDHEADGGDRWFEVVRQLLSEPASPWWDDRTTPAVESADAVITAAMVDAAGELAKRLGDDPAGWRWGRLHQLTVRNQTFGKSGIGVVEWMFNHGPADTAGGQSIVNATGWDASVGYEVDWVPSMRMIADLSNLDGSRWVQLTGESGHAFSAHYHDQFELWRTGRMVPMRWNRDTITGEAADTLTLRG